MKRLVIGIAALAAIVFAGSASAVPLPPERPAMGISEDIVLTRYGDGQRGYRDRMHRGYHRGWMQGRHRGWMGGHHRGGARGRYGR